MSENTQVSTVDTYVDPDFTEDQELTPAPEPAVTAYKAAGLVNGWLQTAGIDKVLPPQMFYNYTIAKVRQGKKAVGGLVLVDNKITISSLEAWFTKYAAKLTS